MKTITGRLMLINSLISIGFIIVLTVVYLSFNKVEKALTSVFVAETELIIDNSHVARQLSRVLAEMDLILRTFYERNDILDSDGPQLVENIDQILWKKQNDELNQALTELRQHIKNVLRQCRKVNNLRSEIASIETNFNNEARALDNVIAESLVELIVAGEDTAQMEQLSSLIGGYRESFKAIELQFVQLGLKYFKLPYRAGEHPLVTQLQDLQLRLRTLTASAPLIAAHGTTLMHLTAKYQDSVPLFHDVVGKLELLLSITSRKREQLLSIMEATDERVIDRTSKTTVKLTDIIHNISVLNLFVFCAIIPLLILGYTTARSIKKPIWQIIEYINKISRGDIPPPLERRFKSEFEEVGDNLNLLIETTNNVTQLAEDIASGKKRAEVAMRSDKDRLTQALNSMTQSLGRLQEETDGMIRTVNDGRLDVRGDSRVFQGGWRSLIVGINNLIRDLSGAVSSATGLQKEMELAKRIQTSLLPRSVENIHRDLEITAAMFPAEQVGGDLYEVVVDKSGSVWICIGDVSGHGVTSGLIMMMAQTINSTLTSNLEIDARTLVVKLNEMLFKNVRERLGETHFMTFTALKYLGEGTFQHAGAHLSMLVVRGETDEVEFIQTKGVYLNLKKDVSAAIKNGEFQLDVNDTLVLYTDGLTEAENERGEMLDIDQFAGIVSNHVQLPPDLMKERIMDDVFSWSCENRSDDMTIIIVRMLSK